MQYYLVRLSYTSAAWRELIENPPKSLDDRLANVRALVSALKGSFATYHFTDLPEPEIVTHKFIPFGNHDIVTILAMPDNLTARTFSMAVSAEDGVKNVEVTPMLAFEEAIEAMAMAKDAKAAASYSAPGQRK